MSRFQTSNSAYGNYLRPNISKPITRTAMSI